MGRPAMFMFTFTFMRRHSGYGLWSLVLLMLLGACAEPFGSPIPADIDPVEPAPDLAVADRRSDAGTAKDAGSASDAGAKPKPDGGQAADKEQDVVDEKAKGDVLLMNEDQTWGVLPGANIRLVCRGSMGPEDGEEGNNQYTRECTSRLMVHTGDGKKQQLVAETDQVPGIQGDFNADGGDHLTTLSLDFMPLLTKPRVALLRVTQQIKHGESLISGSSTSINLYAIRGKELVRVLEYTPESSYKIDSEPPEDRDESSKATLFLDKKQLTNGLPNLRLRESSSTRLKGHTKKKNTQTDYFWNCASYGPSQEVDSWSNCGACGRRCGATEACCDKKCTDITTVQSCGGCKIACTAPGPGTVPSCMKPDDSHPSRCGFACAGDRYDIDGDPKNGCEVTGKSAALDIDRGVRGCGDANSAEELSGELLSDARRHEQPEVRGFDARTGAARTTISVQAAGGWFCQNDLRVSLRLEPVSGAPTPAPKAVADPAKRETRPCYRFTVRTDRGQRHADLGPDGTATIASGRGAYSSGATIRFTIEKICRLPVQEAVRYTLGYHL